MKKKFIALIAAIFAAIGVSALAACSSRNVPEGVDYSAEVSTDTLVVFIAPEVPEDMSVESYILGLDENGVIELEGSQSDYGYFIQSVNGTANETHVNGDGSSYGMSWSLYTDFLEEDGVVYASTEFQSYKYGDKTLGYANYGVSSMPCVEGYTYALVYESWSYDG